MITETHNLIDKLNDAKEQLLSAQKRLSNLNRIIGQDMRLERSMACLSLRSVAKQLGFSAPFVSDLELGRRNWTVKLIEKYEAAINQLNTPITK